MFGLGPLELFVILFIVIMVFGAKRLPELGGAFGESIKNFKKGYRDSKVLDVSPEKNAIDSKNNVLSEQAKKETSSLKTNSQED